LQIKVDRRDRDRDQIACTGMPEAPGTPAARPGRDRHGPRRGGSVPSAAVSQNTLRSQGIVDELFGQPNGSTAVTMTGGAYNFVYQGIPGAPGGLYFQH
jgi:hypothetical protein